MDNERFDKLAKSLASGLTRRRALKGMAASALVGLAGWPKRIGAQDVVSVESVEAAAHELIGGYVWDADDPLDGQTYDLLVRLSGARALTDADQDALAAEVEALANAYYGHFGAEDENGVDQGAAVGFTAVAIGPRWRCVRRCVWSLLLCLLGCRGRRLCMLWCFIKFVRCLIRCRRVTPTLAPAGEVDVAVEAGE